MCVYIYITYIYIPTKIKYTYSLLTTQWSFRTQSRRQVTFFRLAFFFFPFLSFLLLLLLFFLMDLYVYFLSWSLEKPFFLFKADLIFFSRLSLHDNVRNWWAIRWCFEMSAKACWEELVEGSYRDHRRACSSVSGLTVGSGGRVVRSPCLDAMVCLSVWGSAGGVVPLGALGRVSWPVPLVRRALAAGPLGQAAERH